MKFRALLLYYFIALLLLAASFAGCGGGGGGSSAPPPSSSGSSGSSSSSGEPSVSPTIPTQTTGTPSPSPTQTELEIIRLLDNIGASGSIYPHNPAMIQNPKSIAINSANYLVVTDHDNYRWEEIVPTSQFSNFAFGTYGTGDSQFLNPEGIAVDNVEDLVYVVEKGGLPCVKIFTRTGSYLGRYGSGTLQLPEKLALDSQGQLHVADSALNQVIKYTRAGAVGQTIAGLSDPRDVAVGTDGSIYVADTGANRICKFSGTTGALLWTFGSVGSGQGQFNGPVAIELLYWDNDPNKFIAVCDYNNQRIQVFYNNNSHDYLGQYRFSGDLKPLDFVSTPGLLYTVCSSNDPVERDKIRQLRYTSGY